jgi:hypothetical protein
MKIKDTTLSFNKTALLIFCLLLGIAIVAPLAHNQFVSGAIVNATLLIAVAMLGMRNALLIGLLPSSVALATGLLPAVLAPMLLFVVVGNAVLVLVFGFLRNRNYWLGALSGACLKFAFLWSTSTIVTGLILNSEVAKNAALMMSWPQLVTAISGSIIAFLILHFTGKIKPDNT